MESRFTAPKTLVIPWLVQGWRLSQASSNAEDNRRTPANAADDLEQPCLGDLSAKLKKVSRVTKGCFEAMCEHFEHSQ